MPFYEMKIKFKRFRSSARTPTRATKRSAGYDLYSTKNVELRPHSINTFSTDVRFKIPKNYFGKTHPCSSYALKFTDVAAGVIDSDYSGKVSVVFF